MVLLCCWVLQHCVATMFCFVVACCAKSGARDRIQNGRGLDKTPPKLSPSADTGGWGGTSPNRQLHLVSGRCPNRPLFAVAPSHRGPPASLKYKQAPLGFSCRLPGSPVTLLAPAYCTPKEIKKGATLVLATAPPSSS